jgi:hypothetical protein
MDATMRWLAPLLLIGSTLIGIPTHAQLDQAVGPSGDFRVNDRPGTAPTDSAVGGPSVPTDSTLFRDFTGTKSPDEMLKTLDKDLGKSSVNDPGAPSSGPSMELEKDFPPASDRFFK